MKNKLYTKKFYINAVHYFYGCETKKQAKEIYEGFTQKDLDALNTLIYEFNNDDFLANF